MLNAYTVRFDVTENFKNFLLFGSTKQGRRPRAPRFTKWDPIASHLMSCYAEPYVLPTRLNRKRSRRRWAVGAAIVGVVARARKIIVGLDGRAPVDFCSLPRGSLCPPLCRHGGPRDATLLFYERSAKTKPAVNSRQLFFFLFWKVHMLLFIFNL